MSKKRGNGEGSIYKRADGRWCAQTRIGRHPDGRPRRLSIYGKTRKEVAVKLAQVIREQQLGTYVPPDNQTVEEYITYWLEHSRRNRLRAYTYVTYESPIRVHIIPALGDTKLQELTAPQVQALVDDLYRAGKADSTVKRIHTILHRALEQAYRWGLINRNVADQVELRPAHAPRMRFLDEGQARALLRAVRGDRMEAYYTVALALGLRRGEALGLRWEDVDWDARRLHVRRSLQRIDGRLRVSEVKTDASHRGIRLPGVILEALAAHRVRQLAEREAAGALWRDSGFIFTTHIGTAYEPRNIRRHFLGLLSRAGLPPMRVHDMRHTAASLMFAEGIPLEVISEILGHADKRTTTNVYLHIFERDHEQAAHAMDDMLRRLDEEKPRKGRKAQERAEDDDDDEEERGRGRGARAS